MVFRRFVVVALGVPISIRVSIRSTYALAFTGASNAAADSIDRIPKIKTFNYFHQNNKHRLYIIIRLWFMSTGFVFLLNFVIWWKFPFDKCAYLLSLPFGFLLNRRSVMMYVNTLILRFFFSLCHSQYLWGKSFFFFLTVSLFIVLYDRRLMFWHKIHNFLWKKLK